VSSEVASSLGECSERLWCLTKILRCQRLMQQSRELGKDEPDCGQVSCVSHRCPILLWRIRSGGRQWNRPELRCL
jgi:hypothetical protein